MFSRQYTEYIETKSKNDITQETMTLVMRDTLHNLDLVDDKNLQLYNEYKLNYIALFEGAENRAYDDAFKDKKYKYANEIFAAGLNPRGKITVGYGFNMDRPEARTEWENILGNKVSFDDVYTGKVEINNEQMRALLKYSVDLRENELKRSYGGVFESLKLNEQLAILSAYYNGPKLVNTKTRFFLNLKNYIATNDPKYLQEAATELSERSGKDPKLIPRRRLEAILLDSTKVPFYVKPNENTIPYVPLKIVLDKTRVPLGLENLIPAVQNSDFFIWRTKLDNKVRDSHLEREGQVYHKSMLCPKEYIL